MDTPKATMMQVCYMKKAGRCEYMAFVAGGLRVDKDELASAMNILAAEGLNFAHAQVLTIRPLTPPSKDNVYWQYYKANTFMVANGTCTPDNEEIGPPP